MSATLTIGATLATRRPMASAATVLAIGMLKECWDVRTTGFDAVDLAADVLGVLAGASAAAAGP